MNSHCSRCNVFFLAEQPQQWICDSCWDPRFYATTYGPYVIESCDGYEAEWRELESHEHYSSAKKRVPELMKFYGLNDTTVRIVIDRTRQTVPPEV